MSKRPWYKRYGGDFVLGTMALSLEEKGAYSLCLDLIYDRGGPIPDDARWLAGMCGVSLRKWSALRDRLIATGKLIASDGHLTNGRAEREIAEAAETHRNYAESGAKGGRKRAENASKVKDNLSENGAETQENSDLAQAGLKHNQKLDIITPLPPKGETRRKPKRPIPPGFPEQPLIDEQQAKARSAGADIDIANQAERFRNWSVSKDSRYADWPAAWRNWCDRAIREAPRTTIASLSAKPVQPETDRWRRWLREFRQNGHWPTDDAGPRPGHPACRVPPVLLAEFGLAPAPANDPKPDLFARGDAA